MTPLEKELRRLGGLKRSRKSLDAIGEQLEELNEHAESAADFLATLESAREAVSALEDSLDSLDDNPLAGDPDALRDALAAFTEALPGNDGESLTDLIEEARSAHESYQEIADDREYTAQDREDAWCELCDALENIANALARPEGGGK